MPLQYKVFHLHALDSTKAVEELNSFLASVRMVNIYREFVNKGDNSFWSVAVEYMTDESGASGSKKKKKSEIDYREVLSPEDFAIYSKIRTWRKQTAEKNGVPIYAVFKNVHMAKMAEDKITTKEGLLGIDGVGDGRVTNYGDEVISVIKQALEGKEQTKE